MESEFIALGFDKFFYVKGIHSIAGYFSKNNRCGVYILHFEDGEYYVGLSKNVVSRYAQHKLNHSDIEYISFREVNETHLPIYEKETLQKLEELKKTLRNISLVSNIQGETDFDLLVPREEQNKWINYELPFESLTTERFEYPDLRKKYSRKYQKLKSHPLFDSCCEILQNYVYYTIPYPWKSEYSFWSCSCLPDKDIVLARVNMFWQETLIIIEEEMIIEENDIKKKALYLNVVIWLSKSKLFEHYTKEQLLAKYQSLSFGDNIHETGGQDQLQVYISEFEFLNFLYDKPVSDSIKEFNLRLLRKGGCIFGRYHCFDLADEAVRADNLLPE